MHLEFSPLSCHLFSCKQFCFMLLNKTIFLFSIFSRLFSQVNLDIQVLSNALTWFLSLAAASTAKAPQKTAPQRNLGSKGSPSSSLQRLPNLSSALPATSGPSTTGAWKGSLNASTPAARSSATSSTVKTTGKTTKERTYVFLFVLC